MYKWKGLIAALALGGGLALTACSGRHEGGGNHGLVLPDDVETAAAVIDQQTLAGIVEELSDDSYGGRGPATEGDENTQQFIIDYLSDLGYEPGVPDGSWRQPIDIVGIQSKMPETWTFRKGAESWDAAWWEDYIAASGVQEETVSIEDAEVVFVGYGIEASEENWDDFKGADLSGKILLMLNNDPDWDPAMFAGERRLYYGRWTYKYESAARRGAAGAIIIHSEPSAGYPYQVVQTSWTGEQFELPAGDEPRIRLAGWLTEAAAAKLAAFGGQDLDSLVRSARSREFEPVPLGVTTSIDFTNTLNPALRTANIVGLLPGSDPELAREFVVYTAHHDHLGVGEADDSGDAIYNGARDNATGVASILSIAKAFAALEARPRRSIMILPVAAEEQGLLGSQFFAQNPTNHPGRLAANLNFDAGNIFGRTRDVAIVGRGKSDLEDLLEAAAARQDRIVVDESDPDKGYYYRSDQFNFAKIGVPALYFDSGMEYRDRPEGWGREMKDGWRKTRYHQPSDEIYEDWSYEGMIEDSRLAFYVGLSVAQADGLPGWRPGDEFELIRKEALQAASALD